LRKSDEDLAPDWARPHVIHEIIITLRWFIWIWIEFPIHMALLCVHGGSRKLSELRWVLSWDGVYISHQFLERTFAFSMFNIIFCGRYRASDSAGERRGRPRIGLCRGSEEFEGHNK
jgi:hypothetical protein